MASRLPFGKETRVRILKQHFAEAGNITPENAWQFIYRELLWIDGSTGLAHLYESDKAQQGRPWYDRSIVFTDMLCERFGNISRDELKQQIDRLFRACLQKVIEQQQATIENAEIVGALATQGSLEFPQELVQAAVKTSQESVSEAFVPDTDLVADVATLLVNRTQLDARAAEAFARELVAMARIYFTVERKRQNVLGEGFEDLLQLLMLNVSRVPDTYIVIRQRANTLPGFQKQTSRERVEAPDLAIVRNGQTELLASIKWSLRQDRQKQLSDELDCYVDLLSQDHFPQYILITNEYDPGRLVNTDGLGRRGQRIDRIYHINLELLLGALHDHRGAKDLRPLIASGRLRSIEDFLKDMSSQYGQT